MDFLSREAILHEMNDSLEHMLQKYNLEDIGIFEEEGGGDRYYLGYTVRKNGEVYMVHMPFVKNEEGQLARLEEGWVIESDEGDGSEARGYENLDDAFNYLELGF